jgi:hypothetical protein
MRTSLNYEGVGIPQDEQIDSMNDSPVTKKEMKDAVEALGVIEAPEAPEVERGIEEPLVTEEEMRQAVEALDEEPVGDISDDDRISNLREELANIPPAQHNDAKKGYGGDEGGRVTYGEVFYKKCEKCKGSGKSFLFLNCPVCRGRGQIQTHMKTTSGTTIKLSNE